MLDGLYGTKVISPNTDCDKCSNRAIGVFVETEHGREVGTPLCSRHKDVMEHTQEHRWNKGEYRRFID